MTFFLTVYAHYNTSRKCLSSNMFEFVQATFYFMLLDNFLE